MKAPRRISESTYSILLLIYSKILGKVILRKGIYMLIFSIIILSSIYVLHFYTKSLQITNTVLAFNQDKNMLEETEIVKEVEGEEVVYPRLTVDLEEYKTINEDTVGYLSVPFIDLGLPIVQGDDNEEYLKKDFKGNQTDIGWVFLDSRAKNTTSEDNKVIFGHNVITNNMFGNLKKLLNYKEDKPQYITYNTEKSSAVYQIVSVYITDFKDWDYIKRDFTPEEKVAFINMLKERNIVESLGEELHYSDNFLTLSTCYGIIGTTKRLAIHAKKVYEEYLGS